MEQLPNPRHERLPLYSLTLPGDKIFRRAMKLEGLWAERLVNGLSKEALQCTLRTLDDVFLNLDAPVPSPKELRTSRRKS